MKRLFASVLTVGLLSAVAAPVQAFGFRHRCGEESCCPAPCATPCASSCAPAPCAAPAPTYVDKIVTCYRQEVRERDVTCTINRMVSRVVVEHQKCTVMQPYTTQEKRTCTEYTRVPRQVTRDVCCCRKVPVCVVDPCTGCTRTCCKTESYVQHVTCTVYDCVPVQREYTVSVCHYRPVEKTIECRRVVCECKPETVVQKERYCVCVPYQVTVKVAVCTPSCATTSCCASTSCCDSGCGHKHRGCSHKLCHRNSSCCN